MSAPLFGDGDDPQEAAELTLAEATDLFLMRWVPRVQQAAAKPELEALIKAVRSAKG